MGLPITIHVFACKFTNEKTGKLDLKTTVSPEVLNLPQTVASGPVTINFQIESSGYRFDERGIQFLTPDASKQFGDVAYADDRRSATVENDNSDGQAFAYRVYVTDKNGEFKASVDPVVQNDTR